MTNPGPDPAAAFYDAVPLPPGVTINKNVGGTGFITGTPTVAGVYPVTQTAGDVLYTNVVQLDITMTIESGASPPTITNIQLLGTAGSASFVSVSDLTYTLEYTGSLNPPLWIPLDPPAHGTGGVLTLVDTNGLS